MECNGRCLTREAIENSDHPNLEAPCTLIYVYMNPHERSIDIYRAKIHILEHKLAALRGHNEGS